MSATPTRVGGNAPTAMPPSALLECNRVLESVERHESLRSLLAFSDLHQQIREQRPATSPAGDWDLFQAEHVVRDEVLQLICDRALALTNADAVVVALAEGSEMVCRATAGPMPVPRGIRLCAQSDFLRECLQSGKALRCDDSQTDPRVEVDFLQQLTARASVLVPLHGRAGRLGVLQAFSKAPWSFTDEDVRCLDLLAELVLAALRPEDQDRRFQWLSKIADEVLKAKPKAIPPAIAGTVVVTAKPVEQTTASEQKPVSEIAQLTQPILIPVAASEFPEVGAAGSEVIEAERSADKPLEAPEMPEDADEDEELLLTPSLTEVSARTIGASMPQVRTRRLGANLGAASLVSRPGLAVVLGLVVVASLFSAGVWWGMQVHGKAPFAKVATRIPESAAATAATAISGKAIGDAQNMGAAVPMNTASAASDNLMDPAQVSQSETLQAVPESKLAALPRITGLRHWSSSVGSTVVIDMEDQVPYEVHRLMSPERIYFDLHDTVLAPELNGKTMDVGDVSLTRVRVAQPVAGVTRIVLDTKDGSNFSVSMESSPYRLVVELRDSVKSASNRLMPITPAASKAGASPALMAATSVQPLPQGLTAKPLSVQPQQSQPIAKTGKFRIVLDAGHGGWDLGTVGRQGLLEKDLVLDVTRRLGKLLEARLGSEVMFTRTGDDYLPLDQRADFANQSQADLFVSVHANYSTSATARGVETYYTNSFVAPGSKELENHADGSAAKLTPVSLSAGGLHEKTEQSRRLAANVQRALYATLATKSPDIRDRGIKDASFAVLKGTTMPAILTEISFVSSPADEQNLQSEAYRQQIAEALYKGIARYEESTPHAKVAQLRPASASR